jgi:hypothetical protein
LAAAALRRRRPAQRPLRGRKTTRSLRSLIGLQYAPAGALLAEPGVETAVALRKSLIAHILLAAAWGAHPALAEEPPTPPAVPLDPDVYATLSEEEILALAGEVIMVWDERPEKPFDRDTALRLDDDDLARRGATDLAGALDDLPDVTVRSMGRGGQQIDIRGARKAGVKILVDGIALEDPYYGTFDLSSVNVTDVVQIRVATSPSSPIDGPGGPGGVVEVHTRDAIGQRGVIARVGGDTLPTATAAATGRAPIAPGWAARLSATGTLGSQDLPLPDATIDEQRHLAGGAARLEWRPSAQAERRAVLDVAAQSRAFVVPPSVDDQMGDILVVRGETSGRAGARYEDRLGDVKLDARLGATAQDRDAIYYDDPALTTPTVEEHLRAGRAAASVLANRPVGRDTQLVAAAHLTAEQARVVDGRDAVTEGRSSIGELAAGAQWQHRGLRLDGAGAIAVPIGVGEAPWPEAKLTAAATPVPALTVTATIGRKGRLPSLRERYRLDVGNAALDPEMASFAELRVDAAPATALDLGAASWVRRQTGTIALDRMTNDLANLGRIDLRGVDAHLTVRPEPRVALRGAYSFTDADDDTSEAPLDFLPRHKLHGEVEVTPVRRVTASTRLTWVSAQIDREVEIAPHAAWDLDVAYQPVEGWLVAGGVDDLLDSRWEIRPGVPSAGRTFRIAAQATFE